MTVNGRTRGGMPAMRNALPAIRRPRRGDGIQLDVEDPAKARQDYLDRLDAVPHVIALQRVVDGLWTQQQYAAWCELQTHLEPLDRRNRHNAFKYEDKAEAEERKRERDVMAQRVLRQRKEDERHDSRIRRRDYSEAKKRDRREANKRAQQRRREKRQKRMERIFGPDYARKRAEGRTV